MEINNIYIKYILLVCIFFSSYFSSVQSQYVYERNLDNDHYYQFIPVNLTYEAASNYCSNQVYNDMKGYLFTIDNKVEYDFIVSLYKKYVTARINFWVNGRTIGNDNTTFYFTSGPRNGSVYYDGATDYSLYYTRFQGNEPNLNGEDCLHFYHTTDVMNNFRCTNVLYYICEYGGLERPFIEPVTTDGGGVVIKNILGMDLNGDLSNLSVTLYNSNTTRKCLSITGDTSTSIQCYIQPGSGRYNVTISNGEITLNTTFQYAAPHVSLINPMFQTDDILTISGYNFGVGAEIKTWITNYNFNCTFLEKINPYIYTCKLTRNVVAGSFATIVEVDGVTAVKNKPTLIYKKKMFSCFKTVATYENSLSFARNGSSDDMYGTLGYVDEPQFALLLNRTCTFNVSQPLIWTSLYYDFTNSRWSLADGPNKDKEAFPFDARGSVPIPSGPTQYSFKMNESLYLPDTYLVGTLVEYYTDAPSFLNGPSKFGSPTMGSGITFEFKKFGNSMSKLFFNYRGNSYEFTRNFGTNRGYFRVPAGTGAGPYNITMTMVLPTGDIMNSTSYHQVYYYPPKINSIIGSRPFEPINITGTDFGNNVSAITVKINGVDCQDITILTNYTKLSCIHSGNGLVVPVVLTVDGQQTNFTFSFERPVITSYSPLTVDGGWLTISGDYLLDKNANVSLLVGSLNCINITFIKDNTDFKCLLPPFDQASWDQSQPINLQLFINEISPVNTTEFRYLVPSVSDCTPSYPNTTTLLTITGSNFSNSSVSISIGGEPCYNSTVSSISSLTCYFDGIVTPVGKNISLYVNVSNSIVEAGGYLFYYLNKTEVCPIGTDGKICSGNGLCEQSRCNCFDGWTLQNCSQPGTTPETPIIKNDTIVNPSNVNFTSAFIYLREIDTSGNFVKVLKMSDIQWKKDNTTNNNSSLIGTFKNETIVVSISLIMFTQPGSVIFAGETILMQTNSIKYTISISNWSFKSQLNVLQLIFQTMTNSTVVDECGVETPVISTSSANSNNYQVIAKSDILSVNFAKHYYADGRIVLSNYIVLDQEDPIVKESKTNTNNSSFIYTMSIQVPAFSTSITVDPSISSLIISNGNGNSQGCGKSDNKKWKVIVIAVICSVVGAAIILTSAFLIRKKLKWRKETNSLKMKELSSQK